jgi:hypothetical protein
MTTLSLIIRQIHKQYKIRPHKAKLVVILLSLIGVPLILSFILGLMVAFLTLIISGSVLIDFENKSGQIAVIIVQIISLPIAHYFTIKYIRPKE